VLTLYGIPNCDTCRKARKFLEQDGVDYRFHDLREDRLDRATLERWVASVGLDALLNRRSTTWRSLTPSERDVGDPAAAVALMARHPTLVKRPVAEKGEIVRVGFNAGVYREL
jgi:Spx/MgsR family transcriptional regulator